MTLSSDFDSEQGLLEKRKAYGLLLEADFYGNQHTLDEGVSHAKLNKASIPGSPREVVDKINEKKMAWEKKTPTTHEGEAIVEEARRKAADMMGVDPRNIMLTANTTEAIAICSYWLAGQDDRTSPEAVISNGENPSILNSIAIAGNSGNRDHRDPLTTYEGLDKAARNVPQIALATRHKLENIHVLNVYKGESIDDITSQLHNIMLHHAPSTMVISHVLRHNGAILPIKQIANLARKIKKEHHPNDPEIFICGDGAMAFGNIEVDVTQSGCDAYIASPHKTLGTTTMGIAWLNPDSNIITENLGGLSTLQSHQQIIGPGMFHCGLGVRPNADCGISLVSAYGFSQTIDFLEKKGWKEPGDNGFSTLAEHRRKIKVYAETELIKLKSDLTPLTFSPTENGSPFILSFNLFGCEEHEPQYEPGTIDPGKFEIDSMEKRIAKRLHEKGVALSFIRRSKLFRISFHHSTTYEEINHFINSLKAILKEMGKI